MNDLLLIEQDPYMRDLPIAVKKARSPQTVAKNQSHLAADWENEITINGQLMRVPFGCELRGLQNGNAEWGKKSKVPANHFLQKNQ